MKHISKNILLGALLACSASLSYADNSPQVLNPPLKVNEPTAFCSNGSLPSCLFSGLLPYNPNNPPTVGGAYFHCDSTNVTNFTMSDVNVLITGFNVQGSLKGPGYLLDMYSFGAYDDKTIIGRVNAKDQNGNPLVCHPGIGTDKNGNQQQIFPGPPGGPGFVVSSK